MRNSCPLAKANGKEYRTTDHQSSILCRHIYVTDMKQKKNTTLALTPRSD